MTSFCLFVYHDLVEYRSIVNQAWFKHPWLVPNYRTEFTATDFFELKRKYSSNVFHLFISFLFACNGSTQKNYHRFLHLKTKNTCVECEMQNWTLFLECSYFLAINGSSYKFGSDIKKMISQE